MTVHDAEPNERTPRRRAGWILALVVGIVVVLVPVGFAVSIPLANDAAAREVEEELLALPLPDGAERVDSLSQAGKLVGNGNGMQYLGALLIRSDRSLDELREFYGAESIGEGSPVTVIPTTGSEMAELHGARGFLSAPGTDDLYVVCAWGDGPGGLYEEFDLRGH